MYKEQYEIREDIIERREDEKAEKELMSYFEKISKCPYCPMRFVGTPSEKEKTRITHIKREHPGKRPFVNYHHQNLGFGSGLQESQVD